MSNSGSWDDWEIDQVDGLNDIKVDSFPQESCNTLYDATQAMNGERTSDSAGALDTAAATNATDADLFELLVNYDSVATNTDQEHPVEAQSMVPPAPLPIEPLLPIKPLPAAHPPQGYAKSSKVVAPLVIKQFQYGEPGAPVV
ncbi:hypothetical protein EI94DRAFT_1805976 [Lactarius quietus]|nr:hypothetical protein EI94DRAFT_1805976 [Lactarius quietus]